MTSNQRDLDRANRLLRRAMRNGRMQRQQWLISIIWQLAAAQADMVLAGVVA